MKSSCAVVAITLSFAATATTAFVAPRPRGTTMHSVAMSMSDTSQSVNLHGQGSSFLPLEQLDQEYFAPRVVQIAGSYPGITKEEIMAVSSAPPAEPGQWSYDFCDPDGAQLGTVALQGSSVTHSAEDPIVLIAEHTSLGIELPPKITDIVDLIVMVDRARPTFAERKFLLIDVPNQGVSIGAYATKQDLPVGGTILGQVLLVQIPWLPAMKPTRSGFMESDEYF